MQTHQDLWFSARDQLEHIYFRESHSPYPVLDFLPWPIRVTGIEFPDGSQQFTAGGGGGGGGPALIAGPGISLTPGVGTLTIANTSPALPAAPPGGVQFNSAGAFGASANLVWDNVNRRLGIGNTAPAPYTSPGSVLMVGETTSSNSGDIVIVSNIPGPHAGLGSLAWANFAFAGAEKRLCEINATTEDDVNSGDMLFWTYKLAVGNERMRITALGDVGIGTGTPAPDRLRVTDQTTIGIYVSDPVRAWIGSRGNYRLELGVDNASAVVILPNDNTGIALNDPQYRLDVFGSINIRDPGGAAGSAFRVNGVPIGAAMAVVNATAPGSPQMGTLWYNMTTFRLMIWLGSWVQV